MSRATLIYLYDVFKLNYIQSEIKIPFGFQMTGEGLVDSLGGSRRTFCRRRFS